MLTSSWWGLVSLLHPLLLRIPTTTDSTTYSSSSTSIHRTLYRTSSYKSSFVRHLNHLCPYHIPPLQISEPPTHTHKREREERGGEKNVAICDMLCSTASTYPRMAAQRCEERHQNLQDASEAAQNPLFIRACCLPPRHMRDDMYNEGEGEKTVCSSNAMRQSIGTHTKKSGKQTKKKKKGKGRKFCP